MNNTTKAKYLMAQKMFLGHIDIEEVALMTGLSMDELKVIQEVVSLIVFTLIVTLLFKGESLHWNHLAAFVCLVLAVFFVFLK